MHRTLITALLFSLGCKDEDLPEVEADTDTDADADTDADTDSDIDGLVMTPGSFGVGIAEFAINDQGQAVSFSSFDQAGNPVQGQVAVTVLILDESATTAINDTNSCQITFGVPGPVDQAQWATDAGIYWGFTVPAGSPVVGNTCQNFEFPTEWGDVVTPVAQWDFGFGMNLMDPAIESQLAASLGANWATIEDSVVGAGWYSDLLIQGGVDANGYADGGFLLGSEVDGTFTVQTDGAGNPIQLASDVVWTGSPPPATGAYVGQGVIYIQPATALLGTPQ